MSKLWYYKTNGQQFGPVTSAQLKKLADEQSIGPHDLVRKEGMRDWFPASQVRGLFEKDVAGGASQTVAADALIDSQAAAPPVSNYLTDAPAAIPQALPPSPPNSHAYHYPYQSTPYQPGYYVQPSPVALQASDEKLIDITPSSRGYRYQSKRFSFAEFSSFRWMLTPVIMQILFWLGTAFIILFGLFLMFGGLMSLADSDTIIGLGKTFLGLLFIFITPVIWRIYCEFIIILFAINDNIYQLRSELSRQNNRQ